MKPQIITPLLQHFYFFRVKTLKMASYVDFIVTAPFAAAWADQPDMLQNEAQKSVVPTRNVGTIPPPQITGCSCARKNIEVLYLIGAFVLITLWLR